METNGGKYWNNIYSIRLGRAEWWMWGGPKGSYLIPVQSLSSSPSTEPCSQSFCATELIGSLFFPYCWHSKYGGTASGVAGAQPPPLHLTFLSQIIWILPPHFLPQTPHHFLPFSPSAILSPRPSIASHGFPRRSAWRDFQGHWHRGVHQAAVRRNRHSHQ